jgi:2-haloacid dehalogenase
MLDFDRFQALSFDCYGTLVDWEAGILSAMRPILLRHGVACEDERLLGLYATAESEIEAGPYRTYREVLREVMRRVATALSFQPSAADIDALPGSLPSWPAFPDTVTSLQALSRSFRLAIASNVDDDLFAATRPRLQTEFALVTTAQQVGSYKPAPAHFTRTLEGLGLGREALLHVAQSLFHDIAPAKALGLTTVWVNRRAGRRGSGATPQGEARPDLEVPDLRSLVALIGTARAGGRRA